MAQLNILGLGVSIMLEMFSSFVASANINTSGVAKFVCDRSLDSIPTTYVVIKSERRPFIRWVADFGGVDYTPMRRCKEVTSRMQSLRSQGKLRYITSGEINGERVICTASSPQNAKSKICSSLLITLKPTDYANDVLSQLFNIKQDKPIIKLDGTNDDKLDGKIMEYVDVDKFFDSL
jgi:hypothetical protein